MRVFISGICGFLGTHVAELFKNNGWKVCGIDNLNDFELKRAKFNIKKSREHNKAFLKLIGVDFKKMDCRYVTSEYIFEKFGKIDFIVHCAAQPAMTIALEYPTYDAENNIKSVVNMLSIAKRLKIPLVNCSSIHVYGNKMDGDLAESHTRFVRDPQEINENQPILNGELTPLHVSKYSTELYTNCFAETYKMKTANFRFTGMYGERQFGGMDHGWVANFAIRTVMNRPITIFGTDKQVRDILYASDAAQAFLDWYNNGQPVGTFNIGSGFKNSISLQECLFKLKIFSQVDSQDIKIESKRQGDLWYFVCDYKKAKKEFKWEPKVSVDLGLSKILSWIMSNKELFE